jgi:hypothetical protein
MNSSRRWLSRLYYNASDAAVGSQPVQDALRVLEAKAVFEGPTRPVHVRLAGADGAVFLDLANGAWDAVRIDANGWQVVSDPAVKFRRPPGMEALPIPVRGGRLHELRRFTNIKDADQPLAIGWLIGAMRPDGPKAIFNLLGEQGSAKSFTQCVYRSLIDPRKPKSKSAPRNEDDLLIGATQSWVTLLDNLSGIRDWLSDALCRLATGGGNEKRQLYTDDDQIILEARRPIMLNGITEVATRGDLLDRSIILSAPVLKEHRSEDALWREFEAARPRLLGAVCDAVSLSIRELENVSPDLPVRMADFARWVTAAEASFCESGEFLATYQTNRANATELALEASAVAQTVREFMVERLEWEGTATELLDELNRSASEAVQRQRNWPRSGRGIGSELRRVAPNLRSVGVDIEFDYRAPGGSRRRLIRMGLQTTVPTVPTVPGPVNALLDGPDARDGCRDGRDGRPFRPSRRSEGETAGQGDRGDGSDGRDGLLQTYSIGEPANPASGNGPFTPEQIRRSREKLDEIRGRYDDE